LGATSVLAPIGNDWPPIVRSRADHVHLVTPLGTVLVRPDDPCAGIDRDALHVPVSVAEDLRADTRRSGKRVVLGDRAIITESYDLAQVVIQALRVVLLAAIA